MSWSPKSYACRCRALLPPADRDGPLDLRHPSLAGLAAGTSAAPPDPTMVLEQAEATAGAVKIRCPVCGLCKAPEAMIDMRGFPAIRPPDTAADARTHQWACDGCWTHWVRQRWVVAATGRVLAKSEWVAIHAAADTDMTTDQRALVDGWLVDQRAREAAEVVPAVVGALARAVADHQRRQAAGPGGTP